MIEQGATRRGRKPGGHNRPKAVIQAEKLMRAARKEMREAHRDGKMRLGVVPSMAVPANITPLDFLTLLMRDDHLPIQFRVECAAMALPYSHAKPILGLKDARQLAAFDDDEDDDEIAAVMRRPN